jgi:hypothetical protein
VTAGSGFPGSKPGTWVTLLSEDIGNTLLKMRF